MKSLAALITSIISIAILYVDVSAEKPLTLELKVAPGSSFICQMDMNRNVSQTIDEKVQSFAQNLLMVWRYDVIGEDDRGNFKIDLTYTRVKIKQDFGFQSSEYDSDNPPSYIDPSMRGYGALIGAVLRMTVDKRGNVIELDGAEALLDRVISDLDLPESPRKEQIISEIRKQFGQDALKSSIQQITAFYPSVPIAIGDSWESVSTDNSGFPMRIVSRYTLASRQNGMARIELNSTITASPDSHGIDMGDIKIFYDIAGEQSGVIMADEKTGLPVNSEMDMGFEGTVRAEGVPDQPARFWPIKADGRAVVTFEQK